TMQEPLGLTKGGRIVAPLTRLPATKEVGFFDFSIEMVEATGDAHQWVISLPDGAKANEIALSPRGDLRAWRFSFERSTSSGTKVSSEELWVSQLDGTYMRLIGWVEARPPLYDDLAGSLRWTPDGKNLSFIYQKALYTVPVN